MSNKSIARDAGNCATCRWDNEDKCILTGDCRHSPTIRRMTVGEFAKTADCAGIQARVHQADITPFERALATQVGGGHYKDMAIQPAEFIHRNKIEFLPGCVIKRMCRWRKKDGLQDLRKAIHEIELMIELESNG